MPDTVELRNRLLAEPHGHLPIRAHPNPNADSMRPASTRLGSRLWKGLTEVSQRVGALECCQCHEKAALIHVAKGLNEFGDGTGHNTHGVRLSDEASMDATQASP